MLLHSVLMHHCWSHDASSRGDTARGGTWSGATRGSRGELARRRAGRTVEAREVSSRGGARGEQSRSSSSVQAHQTRQMGLNSGRQRQHRNDGDGTARGQHNGSTARRWEYNSKAMAMQETELSAVITAPGHGLNM